MNGYARLVLVVLLVGGCLPMSADDSALFGEQGAYVPCDEAAADLPAYDPDSLAIAGRETGYVPPDTAAAALPASDDDSVALYGHGVGHVAKPCCGFFDDLARADQSGWGTAKVGRDWTTSQSPSGGVVPTIASNEGVLHANASKYAYANLTIDADDDDIVNPLDVYVTFRVTVMGGADAALYITPQHNQVYVKPTANSITNDNGDTSAIPRVIDWSQPVTVRTRMTYDSGPGEMTRQIRVWQTADSEPGTWDDTFVNAESERHASEMDIEVDADGSGPFEVRVQQARVVVNDVEVNSCATFRDAVETITDVLPLTGAFSTGSYLDAETWVYDHLFGPWAFRSGAHLGGIVEDVRSGPTDLDPPPTGDIYERSWVTFVKPSDPDLVEIVSAELTAGIHVNSDPAGFGGSDVTTTEQPWRIIRSDWGASQPTLSEPGTVLASGTTLYTILPGGGATHDPEIVTLSLVPPGPGEYIQLFIETDAGYTFPLYNGIDPVRRIDVALDDMWDEASVFTEATLTYVWTKRTGIFEAVAG